MINMDYKVVLGLIATLIAFIGYAPYFRDIISSKTKPHAFTWLVWTIMLGIAFAGQVSDNAGSGAWVTGFSMVICLIIFLVGLKYGKRNIVAIDWVLLAAAVIAILLWYLTKGPLLSVILVTMADILGFLPTVRKSLLRPYEETASTYFLGTAKYIVSIFALNNISIVTALYPSYLIFANTAFAIMLLVRRKQLPK